MKYIILDNINSQPSLRSDENCQAIIYNSLNEAIRDTEGNSEIVPLSCDLMPTILDSKNFVDGVKFELGEDIDEENLEVRLGNLITHI